MEKLISILYFCNVLRKEFTWRHSLQFCFSFPFEIGPNFIETKRWRREEIGRMRYDPIWLLDDMLSWPANFSSWNIIFSSLQTFVSKRLIENWSQKTKKWTWKSTLEKTFRIHFESENICPTSFYFAYSSSSTKHKTALLAMSNGLQYVRVARRQVCQIQILSNRKIIILNE